MNQLNEQVSTLKSAWKAASEKATAAPAVWQPHWPNGSIAVLDEVVDLLTDWIDRVRAPAGFSPGFQLAKTLAAASMPTLISTAQQLAAGNFNHLPTFVSQLVGVLSAVHSMAVYSNKDDGLNTVGDLQARLAEGVAVLGTAQREFAAKAATLEQVDATVSKIEMHLQSTEQAAAAAAGLQNEISEAHQSARATADQVKTLSDDVAATKDDLVTLSAQAREIKDTMDTQAGDLRSLIAAAKAQSDVIDSILPKAASAGLAAAFATRGSQIEGTKKLWAGAFIVSLVLLAALAAFIFRTSVSSGQDFWQLLALRLTLAAPLVWLGWFSAVQYGNTVRVQEDYAFKEATSRAFQGYRDHMQHMSTIDAPEAGTALKLLAVKTIEILAQEPLRIYEKTAKDASPAHSILDAIRSRSSDSKAQPKA